MARLSREQQQNVATILRVGRQKGASKKVLKAALEAGLVESNLRNLGYGDRDSVGVFQQRPSAGWTGLTNVAKAAAEFYDHAIPLSQKYGSAGQLAQAVQRSAFPGRYDQRSGDANGLLSGVANVRPTPSSTPTAAPAGNQDAIKKQIALSLLGFGNLGGESYGSTDPLTLALAAAQKAPTASVSPSPRPSAPKSGGSASFDGKPVAGWIAPILEKARRTGLWRGSVTSGIRTKSQQHAAAKHYGLQHYPNGPLASNHVEGHNGAVDVSDPQGLKKALRALHSNRLKSAMPEDPVHFSGTGY